MRFGHKATSIISFIGRSNIQKGAYFRSKVAGNF